MSTSCEHGVLYGGPDECKHCVREEEKDKRIAALQQECDQLRARFALLTDPAAVHANILRGALPLTKAQAIHIAGLPADVERELERLRDEVERLGRPVTDEEASDAVTAAMKMEFGGTYQEAMEALIAARRKP